MFTSEFVFGTNNADSLQLYSKSTGFGFLTEENRSKDELLQLPELNNGFETWYWYIGHNITNLALSDAGVYVDSDMLLPLSFKADVLKQGNYKVTIEVNGGTNGVENLMIFTGRRRLVLKDKTLAPNESFTFETIVNVCDFIPRGKEVPFEDNSLCITLIGKGVQLKRIVINEVNVPTFFIAGDSTLTDQTGAYPYIPENCYCGWAQFLTYFLNNDIAVSNHAHSGLTTESFRNEGHYSIIEKYIKPGDFYFLQFGHNDQKLAHLTAEGGYKENVIRYINEIRQKEAFPILVTPLCRNSWRGNDGTYNDLLIDYDRVIKEIGQDMDVPVLNLHDLSYQFITTTGLELSKGYFFPGDFTHTNDYGAYKMAAFIAEELRNLDITSKFVKEIQPEWIAPEKISLATPPKGFENVTPPTATGDLKCEFTDIDSCPNKENIITLTSFGVIPNDSKEFRPNDIITRAEILSMIIKIANFFPTNVYNDYFSDIVGHEWYAGTVECAWSNGIVDKHLVNESKFYPNKTVTYEELIVLCINGYKSRKSLANSDISSIPNSFKCSGWAVEYYKYAVALDILDNSIDANKEITRMEAVDTLTKLRDKML